MYLLTKLAVISTFLMLSMASLAQDDIASPLEVVKQRMKAHNDHDLEAFMAVYSDDIQIYDYPDIPIGMQGKAHIQSIFEPLFLAKSVAVELHHQIAHGKYVVNHETVTREEKKINYVSVYQVEAGLITEVRFLREN